MRTGQYHGRAGKGASKATKMMKRREAEIRNMKFHETTKLHKQGKCACSTS